MLRDPAGNSHDRHGGDGQDDQIGKQISGEQGKRIHQTHRGGNKHHGHDGDEKRGNILDRFHPESARNEQAKQNQDTLDAGGNRQRNEKIERFTNQRDQNNDRELLEILQEKTFFRPY